jgi:hypothetical protein
MRVVRNLKSRAGPPTLASVDAIPRRAHVSRWNTGRVSIEPFVGLLVGGEVIEHDDLRRYARSLRGDRVSDPTPCSASSGANSKDRSLFSICVRRGMSRAD